MKENDETNHERGDRLILFIGVQAAKLLEPYCFCSDLFCYYF